MAMPSRASRLDTYLAGPSRRNRPEYPSNPTRNTPPKGPETAENSDKKKKGKKPGNRFSFSVPARILKRAIAGLADPELNPNGLGMMEVCDDGFEITVHQYRRSNHGEDRVFGLLSLKALGLIDFVCTRSIVRMVKLVGIATYLETNATDADIIKVFHVDGSNHLCFKIRRRFLGIPRYFVLEVPFSNARTITKFPIFSYGFEMSIPSNKLEPVINSILEQIPRRRPPIVSVNIETNVGIQMGSNFEMKVDETMLVWLPFPYWESLKKTSTLADPCTLWLMANPADGVVLRFDLKEYGEFMYLKYASQFFMRQNLPTIGTFWPLFPR